MSLLSYAEKKGQLYQIEDLIELLSYAQKAPKGKELLSYAQKKGQLIEEYAELVIPSPHRIISCLYKKKANTCYLFAPFLVL